MQPLISDVTRRHVAGLAPFRGTRRLITASWLGCIQFSQSNAPAVIRLAGWRRRADMESLLQSRARPRSRARAILSLLNLPASSMHEEMHENKHVEITSVGNCIFSEHSLLIASCLDVYQCIIQFLIQLVLCYKSDIPNHQLPQVDHTTESIVWGNGGQVGGFACGEKAIEDDWDAVDFGWIGD